jgi:hypothetical protein
MAISNESSNKSALYNIGALPRVYVFLTAAANYVLLIRDTDKKLLHKTEVSEAGPWAPNQ